MSGKVLVTGASGLLGTAAIESFLSAGWEVIGVSRRKPDLPSGREIEYLSVDLRDEAASRAAFEPLTDVTHIAYAAIYEKPDLVAGWSSKDQIETNNTTPAFPVCARVPRIQSADPQWCGWPWRLRAGVGGRRVRLAAWSRVRRSSFRRRRRGSAR